MLSLTKQVCVEYCFFIVKIHVKSAKSNVVGKNLNVFVTWSLFWGYHVSFHHWRLRIHSLRLHNPKTFLFVIL
jgi:hypothetical protein